MGAFIAGFVMAVGIMTTAIGFGQITGVW